MASRSNSVHSAIYPEQSSHLVRAVPSFLPFYMAKNRALALAVASFDIRGTEHPFEITVKKMCTSSRIIFRRTPHRRMVFGNQQRPTSFSRAPVFCFMSWQSDGFRNQMIQKAYRFNILCKMPFGHYTLAGTAAGEDAAASSSRRADCAIFRCAITSL